MADNLKSPVGAVPPPAAAGSKVQPKKETVRISLPPKAGAKETVRIDLPPRTGPAAVPPPAPAPSAPKPAPSLAPKPAAPAAPAASAPPPAGSKQTVRLSLPPKPSAGKETVRLELPPKPGAGGAKPGAASGGKEIKLVVPQVDESVESAAIPDAADVEAEAPTMDSSQAQPAAAAPPAKSGGFFGLKKGPPSSKPAAPAAAPAQGKAPAAASSVAGSGKVAQAPASALPDSTPSAMALPAKKALPKPEMTSAPSASGGVIVRRAGWPDYTLAILALGTGIAAVVRLLMILGVFGGE